jgi:VWFA-related protein
VTAFTVTGHRLWQQHWSRYRAFPVIARDRDNSRFGVSTLQLANGAPSVAGNNVDEDDVNRPPISQLDVFEQNVQIIEAASGTAVLSVNVTPAVMSGQNFALSADGAHLAILQDQAIELFDLPPPSEQERVLFSALPTEVTDSFTTASGEDSRTQTPDATAEAGSPETPAAAPVLPPEAQQEKSNPAGVTESALTPSATDRPNPASASQSTASSGDPHTAPITFRVSTRVVAVDVVVTDGKGRPVKGLSQHDFQLAEDGKPQAVRFFREFGDAAQSPAAPPPAPAAVVAPAKSSANVFSNSVHSSEPGALTMILFDLLNTPSQDQVYARQQLIKFLRSKPKESQLALCAMTGDTSHLRLLQGFTADETRLLAAARGKKDSPKAVRWQMAASETEHTVDTVGDLAQGGPMSGFQGLLSAVQGMRAEQEVTDTQSRASITMDSMMVLATYLAGIPGRKNVVWLSGSFPISITATTNSGDLSLDNPNYTAKIKRVTNLLAEAQVAVYPVDVRGILAGGLSAGNAGGMGGPSSTSPADFSANSVISPTPNIPQDMQGLAREAAERDTLTQFAVATGGKAFYNSNGIADAIETAVEQGSNYYTFSYTPANAVYDGKFRKIKVQLAQKGYTLHYRQGYYADDSHSTGRDTELARRTRAAAMQHGTPPSHQLLFSVRVIPVGSKKKIDRVKLGDVLTPSKAPNPPAAIEMQHYIVDYSIQGSELRFVPLANAGYRNVLTLMATSFDIDGQMLTGLSNVGTNDLRPEIYEKVISGEFGVQQEVDIPATAAFLRLGIQDQMTSHIGTVEIPLPVPPVPDPPRRARIKLPDIEPD